MAATPFPTSSSASKFRGCMIGGLVGDCLGSRFEFNRYVSEKDIKDYISNVMRGESVEKLSYSDDTAMTISVASSLVEKEQVDAQDMAQKFVTGFFAQPNRKYGLHVVSVFTALRNTEFKDVFLPAKSQFDGEGSYGNGAAMRIAPIALFGNTREELDMVAAAKECSLITHAHKYGYNGAILQCLAVNAALEMDSSQKLKPVNFINNLLEKMENVEIEDECKPYCESLKKMKKIFLKKKDISTEAVAETFGNGVIAHRSVPSAIYSFLRGLKPLKNYKESNPFVRTMYFAICVKGDTDTIASMAGSIAGAFYGADIIPEVIQKRCELIEEVINLADKLFDISKKK